MIFELEWKSGQFSGENGDWLSELSAGGIFGTGEREAEGYVRGIVCWGGGLGKGGSR